MDTRKCDFYNSVNLYPYYYNGTSLYVLVLSDTFYGRDLIFGVVRGNEIGCCFCRNACTICQIRVQFFFPTLSRKKYNIFLKRGSKMSLRGKRPYEFNYLISSSIYFTVKERAYVCLTCYLNFTDLYQNPRCSIVYFAHTHDATFGATYNP